MSYGAVYNRGQALVFKAQTGAGFKSADRHFVFGVVKNDGINRIDIVELKKTG